MNAILNFAAFSLSTAAATALLLLLSHISENRFSSASRYAIWAVIVVRMCIPLTLFPTFMTLETPAAPTEAGYETADRADTSSLSASSFTVNTPSSSPVSPSAVHSGASSAPTAGRTSPRSLSPASLFTAAYSVAAASIFAVRLIGYNVTMKKIRRSLREPDAVAVGIFRRAAEEMGIKKAPALFVSDRVSGPILCGFFKKKIVLTESAMTSPRFENVIRHELTHHKRGDLYLKLLGELCVSVNFLNPAAYLAVFMMTREMEYSCDERVLSGHSEEERTEYGAAVLAVIKERRKSGLGTALTTEFVSGKKGIKKRFRMIMDCGRKKRGTVVIAVAVLICIAAGSVISFKAASPGVPDETDAAPPSVTAGSAAESASEPETQAESASESEAEDQTESGTESETESETEPVSESTSEPLFEKETDPETAFDPETVAKQEPAVNDKSASEPHSSPEPDVVTGTCGAGLAYSYDIDSGSLTVSGTGQMWDYWLDYAEDCRGELRQASPWVRQWRENIRRVTIEPGVTSIGNCAFAYCPNLTEVTLPATLVSIGERAFISSGVRKITVPEGVVSVGPYCFINSPELETLDLPSTLVSTDVWDVYQCTKLRSINVSGGNPNYTSEDGVLFSKNKDVLIAFPPAFDGNEYVVPATVREIRSPAFAFSKIKKISMPDSIEKVFGNAFEGSEVTYFSYY